MSGKGGAGALLHARKIIIGQPVIKIGYDIAEAIDVAIIDAQHKIVIRQFVLDRQHAVGIDKDRDPAEAQRFIKTQRVVSIAFGRQYKIGIDHVLHILKPRCPRVLSNGINMAGERSAYDEICLHSQ